MTQRILKKILIYLTLVTVVMGMNINTYAAAQNDSKSDGDVIENPWADLFKDNDGNPGDLEIETSSAKKDKNTKDKATNDKVTKDKSAKNTITEDTVKEALKTSVTSAVKKSKNAKKAKIKIKKNTVLKNVRYQIKYGIGKKLKKGKIKTFKKNKITVTKLKTNKKYYVKARAYVVTADKKKIYGAWTKPKAIRVKKK